MAMAVAIATSFAMAKALLHLVSEARVNENELFTKSISDFFIWMASLKYRVMALYEDWPAFKDLMASLKSRVGSYEVLAIWPAMASLHSVVDAKCNASQCGRLSGSPEELEGRPGGPWTFKQLRGSPPWLFYPLWIAIWLLGWGVSVLL